MPRNPHIPHQYSGLEGVFRARDLIRDFSDRTIYLHREELFLEFERPVDSDMAAVQDWQTAIMEAHGKAVAYDYFHGSFRTVELHYTNNAGWSMPDNERS